MNRQAGDRVDALERHRPAARRAPPADDLQRLVDVRERQPGHGDGLQAADGVLFGSSAPSGPSAASPR